MRRSPSGASQFAGDGQTQLSFSGAGSREPRRKRLLVLCDYQPALLDCLADTLNSVGLRDRVIIRKKRNVGWRDEGIRTIALPILALPGEDRLTVRSIASVAAYLLLSTVVGTIAVLKYRLDAILGIFAFPQGLAATAIARITRREAFIMTDGGDLDVLLIHPIVRPIMQGFLKITTPVVTALSETKARKLMRLGVKSQLCPTFGVDTSRFEYIPFDDKEKNLILYVGRLSPEKCPETLLEATEKLHRQGIAMKLSIVGDGPLKNRILEGAARMGIQDIVSLSNPVPHSEIHRFYAKSGIFVLPSSREGVSVALLEAMSSGCLCFVSDIPENKEIVRDKYNGILFRANDGEDLANKIQWAISRPSPELASITANARHLIDRTYSLSAVGTVLNLLLETRLDTSGGC